MRKKHLFLTITAVFMLFAMVLSLAACGGGGNSGDGDSGSGGTTTKEYTTKDIKALKDLTNYSKLTADYKPTKTYSYEASAKKYDGKDCSEQWNKLQTRIEDKTEDVLNGDTDSAVTKIFTKSTPDGILNAIANADLTYDEMVRVVNYIAGEEEAEVSDYVKENADNRSWSGLLTTTSSSLKSWTELTTDDGKPFNTGWSFFDDWELNDRLKEYAKSDYSGLNEGRGVKKTANKNAFGTKDTANDNASWQYRSILEKIYKPASEGGVDLPGNAAARLATYMLEYATEVAEGMANDTIENAANNGNTSAFSTYFRSNLVEGDPYAALADYDVLVYLLSFHDLYEVKPYSGLDGLRSCVQLYGFYYQYNQTYYNIVLKDKARYTNQLKYEKLEVFTDTEWLDYVKIQRENYVGSYRYSADFYFTFYSVHFDFQERKENDEKTVYVISDSISGRSYTKEMKQAINKANKGLEGQLAMSDWTWCYGGSDASMKDYNKANTDYQEGKNSGDKEKEYKGLFYYELEELKIVDYLLTKMSTTELTGALYYNCYAYSGSMINEMQNYAKDIVLINDAIKGYDKFTTVPDNANVNASEYDAYAMGKLAVLKAQAKEDWSGADVDNKAKDAKNQPWSSIAKEIKEAQGWPYMELEAENTAPYNNVWKKRCDYLEDRVVARRWSCCDQRVSEADLKKCSSGHAANKDGSTPTKDYDPGQSTSQFASKYEVILMYVATKAEVSFQTPEKGYHGSSVTATTYTPGYYGNIDDLIDGCKSGSDGDVIKYREDNTMTMAIGASFEKEIVNEDGDDHDWWVSNSDVSKPSNIVKFGPETYTETDLSNQNVSYNYTYTFKGWYLDQECKYVFNPADDIDFNIKLYAGYEIVKAK